jgi:hypothetical protein
MTMHLSMRYWNVMLMTYLDDVDSLEQRSMAALMMRVRWPFVTIPA